MNLLIIGGLVVVGLLAVVGAIALAMGERSATSRTAIAATPSAAAPVPERASAAANTLNTSSANASSAPTVPVVPVSETTTARQDVSVVRDDSSYPLSRDDTQYSSRIEGTRLPASNGQFHELVIQLRSLYSEVSDLERRLNLLSEIADHIERRNNERDRALVEDEHR